MAIYGPQDAMRHEHRDQLQELVVVRGFGDTFDRHFFVKTMRANLRGPKGSKSNPTQLFLESAKTQQRVADAGSRHWATIHLAGTGPKGPYIVLDYYPRSANDFIENKLPLSARSLHRIISGIVDGLIDLQRISDRPHGNLKPSNVLIGPGEVERTEVVLADPAPLEQLATEGRGDAYDLGQLIHCLVLQRKFSGAWPIEPSAGWTSLGSKAKGWRELCNRLLNPNPDKRPRLRQVRADLVKLEPGRSTAPRLAIAAALGTFVLAAGAAIYVYDPLDLRRTPGSANAVPPPSRTGPTTAPVVTRTPTTQMATATNPQGTAAGTESAVATTSNPPQPDPPHKVPKPTQQEKVETAATAMPPETPVVQVPAERLTQVREAQSAFASRGWTGAANYLQEVGAQLTRPDAKPQAEDVSTLEAVATLASQIERDWTTVAQTQATLTAVDDRMVKSYASAVAEATAAGKAEASADGVRKLAESLNRLATDADWAKVVAYVQSPQFKQLDLVYFTQASDAYRNFGDKQVASVEDLRAWVNDATSGKFDKLDPSTDPRRDWNAAQRLQRIRNEELARLAKLGPANGDDAQVAQLRKQLQAIEGSIGSLQSGQIAWDRRNDDRIRSGVQEINETLTRLENELKQAIAQREQDATMAAARQKEQAELTRRQTEVKNFLGQLTGTQVSAIPAVQQAWQAHVESVGAALQKDPSQLGQQTRESSASLQQRLKAVDVAYRALPAPALPRQGMPQWAQDLLERVGAVASDRREHFLNDGLEVARSLPSPEQAQDRLKQLSEEYRGWLAQSQALLADIGDLQSLLAAGYMPDEKPDPKLPSPRELLARIEEHALWKDRQVRAAVEPLVQPVAAADSKEWQALLKAAGTDDVPLGVRVAAWDRLASMNNLPWPANQEDLAENLKIEDELRGATKQRVSESARAERLNARVTAVGRRNWERFLTRAASQSEVEFALRLKDRYVGNDLTALDRRSQFNATLFDLRRLLVEAEKDPSKQAAVLKQIAAVEQSLGALPAELTAGGDVAPLASAIRAYRTNPAGAAVDVSTLGPLSVQGRGPGAIRWGYSYDAQNQTLTCVPELSRELTSVPPEIVFKRVEGDGNAPAFFLSTTEVSVGLFGDIILGTNRAGEFQKLLGGGGGASTRGGTAARDQRVGPRSWYWRQWGSRSILTNTREWLLGEPDHYSSSLGDPINGSQLKDPATGRRGAHLNPSNRHPMQYVSPGAAVAFATMLGCRLPTPEEWQLANRVSRTEQPNLRDQTWRAQYQWAADRRANAYLPDRGIFVPSNEIPNRDVWTETQLNGGARSAADRAYNDGVLFFHEVAPNGGQSFNHLVGNVAEYVLAGERMFVVGASALSPPAPVRAVEQPYEIANWRGGSNEGYSDVGFRLAFAAPGAPFEQLRVVIEKQPYLVVGANPTTRPIAATE